MNLKFMNIKKHFQSPSFLNFIMLTRLIFGGYYQITSSKIISIFMKIYCISITLIVSSVCSFTSDVFSPYMISLLEFNFNAMLSMLTAEAYFLKYCKYIKTADAIVGIKNASLITKDVIFVTAFLFISRAVFTIFYGQIFNIFYSLPSFGFLFSTTFIMFSTDIHFLTVVIVFAILHNRMTILRRSLEKTSVPVNIIGKDEVALKIEKVRNSVRYYNNLLDNLDDINDQVQYTLLVALASAFPQLIMLLYVTVNYYVIGNESDIQIINVFETLQLFLLISSPAVIAEMTTSEVERIKNTITKQLHRCSNQSLRFELEIALDYVTYRPFSFTICRTISLDISMPIGIITMTITYVIVSMQLIHFKY